MSLSTCIETFANTHSRNHLRRLGVRQHVFTCRPRGANTQQAPLRLLEPVPRERRWSEGQGANAPIRHPRSPAAPSHHPCRVQGCCPRWGGPARLAGAAIQSPWCLLPTVAALSCLCVNMGVLSKCVFGGCRATQTLAGVPQGVRIVCMGVVGNVGRCAALNVRGCASWAACRVASRAHSSNHDTRSKDIQARHSAHARAGHSDVRACPSPWMFRSGGARERSSLLAARTFVAAAPRCRCSSPSSCSSLSRAWRWTCARDRAAPTPGMHMMITPRARAGAPASAASLAGGSHASAGRKKGPFEEASSLPRWLLHLPLQIFPP